MYARVSFHLKILNKNKGKLLIQLTMNIFTGGSRYLKQSADFQRLTKCADKA